jgi:uncharacterized membrane-anchored protein YhcB (DUF1043 family)
LKRFSNVERAQFYVIVVLVLTLAIGTIFMVNVNNKLNRSDSNSKERTAETRFLLCSRKAELNTFAKASDVDKVCKGYQTLNQAYATERNR